MGIDEIKYYKSEYNLSNDEILSLIFSNRTYFISKIFNIVPDRSLMVIVCAHIVAKLISDIFNEPINHSY